MEINTKLFLFALAILSMTIIPEFYTPIGRIGLMELFGVAFGVPILLLYCKNSVMLHVFPILFFPFIVLISIMNSSFIGHPFNFSIINFLFGYARSVIYVLIGIYFGRIFPIHLIKKGLDIFIVLAILSILIAWGQFLSEEFTEITKYIYNPFNYNNFNQHWHIRPPGPFVRVFSYAFFTVSLFWLIIFLSQF